MGIASLHECYRAWTCCKSPLHSVFLEIHPHNSFGFLADRPLNISEPEYLSMPHQEFENVWQQVRAFSECA